MGTNIPKRIFFDEHKHGDRFVDKHNEKLRDENGKTIPLLSDVASVGGRKVSECLAVSDVASVGGRKVRVNIANLLPLHGTYTSLKVFLINSTFAA